MDFDIYLKTDKSFQYKRTVNSGVSSMNGQYISIFRNRTTFPESLKPYFHDHHRSILANFSYFVANSLLQVKKCGVVPKSTIIRILLTCGKNSRALPSGSATHHFFPQRPLHLTSQLYFQENTKHCRKPS